MGVSNSTPLTHGVLEVYDQDGALLIISNVFTTIVWYGHLKCRSKPVAVVILVSWWIALFEFIFQVPANRIGVQSLSLVQLKILQECIT